MSCEVTSENSDVSPAALVAVAVMSGGGDGIGVKLVEIGGHAELHVPDLQAQSELLVTSVINVKIRTDQNLGSEITVEVSPDLWPVFQ